MKIFLAIVLMFSLCSCATVDRATDLGAKIGESFAESASKGEPSGEVALKAWPYAHGVIKGLMGPNYDLEMNPTAEYIITRLDTLAQIPPKELTSEDKGYILGALCRLEVVAVEQTWKRYGVNLWRLLVGG